MFSYCCWFFLARANRHNIICNFIPLHVNVVPVQVLQRTSLCHRAYGNSIWRRVISKKMEAFEFILSPGLYLGQLREICLTYYLAWLQCNNIWCFTWKNQGVKLSNVLNQKIGQSPDGQEVRPSTAIASSQAKLNSFSNRDTLLVPSTSCIIRMRKEQGATYLRHCLFEVNLNPCKCILPYYLAMNVLISCIL